MPPWWQRHGYGIVALALAAVAISLWVSEHRSIVTVTETVLANEQELQGRADTFGRTSRQDFRAISAALAVAKQGLQRQEEALQRLRQQYLDLQVRLAAAGDDGRQGVAVMACPQVADGWREIRQAETEVKSVKDDIANFLDIVKPGQPSSLGELAVKFTANAGCTSAK
jgi:hypothetical protein